MDFDNCNSGFVNVTNTNFGGQFCQCLQGSSKTESTATECHILMELNKRCIGGKSKYQLLLSLAFLCFQMIAFV